GADPVAQQRPQLGGVVVPGVIHIAGIERQDIVLDVELHPRPGGGSADKVGGGEFGGVVVVGAVHQGIGLLAEAGAPLLGEQLVLEGGGQGLAAGEAVVHVGGEFVVVVAVGAGIEVLRLVEAVAELVAVALVDEGGPDERRCLENQGTGFTGFGAIDIVVVAQLGIEAIGETGAPLLGLGEGADARDGGGNP